MATPLQIEKTLHGDETHLTLLGDINEEARFDLLGELHGTVTIDLFGIKRINSSGVRQWTQFIKSLPPTTQLRFERCPPAVIAQVNMISNFLGHGKVATFVAPYVCESCQRPYEILLDLAADFSDRKAEAPVRKCSSCGGTLQFDDLEESYFSFIRG